MGACEIATEYAVRISKTATMDELKRLGDEIKLNIKSVEGWDEWLRLFWESHATQLNAPPLTEADFSKEGKKWAKEQGII